MTKPKTQPSTPNPFGAPLRDLKTLLEQATAEQDPDEVVADLKRMVEAHPAAGEESVEPDGHPAS